MAQAPVTPIETRAVTAQPDLEQARLLFEEYARKLGIDLSYQGFDRELRELPGAYAPPDGLLLLAAAADLVAGCVAVRRWSPDAAEMKRLFVKDAFRGVGLGARLAQEAIAWARQAGYRRMLLDTLPSMRAAQRMYERLGFRDVPAYRFSPVEGTRYMELRLISTR